MTEIDPEQPTAVERAAELFVPGEGERLWYVAHARPRCEKRVAEACADMAVRHYLPLRRSTPPRKKGQRRYSFDVPLFPGYLFACCNREERHSLYSTEKLVRVIDVADQEQLLRELTSIYLACHGETELVLYPQLRRGRWVRITQGALTGVEGRISQRKDGMRVVLNVTILGTAVAAEVEMDQVELL